MEQVKKFEKVVLNFVVSFDEEIIAADVSILHIVKENLKQLSDH